MAVKIRLKRMGKIRAPFYRVVVMDSRTKRDGRAIEEIGKYHPTEEPSLIDISSDRAQYWLAQGAQPTEAVAALLKITGDWQKFKGEPGTEGTLRVKEPKTSKKDLYEAALAAAGKGSDADSSGATTPRKRAAAKPAAEAVGTAPDTAADAKADTAKSAAAPVADDAVADSSKAAALVEPVSADTDGGGAAAKSVDADADATTPAADEGSVEPEIAPVADEAAPAADEAAPAADEAAPAADEAAPATDAKELPAGAAAPLEDGSAPEGYTVKGNADSGKFHEPDGQWYGQTVAEFWFKTAADAEAAGFVKAGS